MKDEPLTESASDRVPRWKQLGIRTMEDALRLIPSVVMVTLLGGFFTQCYQARAAKNALEAQEIAANRAAASTLVREITDHLGRRLYLAQAASMRSRRDSLTPFLAPEHFRVIREWNELGPGYRANLCRFFGPVVALRLQRLARTFTFADQNRRVERMNREGFPDADTLAMAFPEYDGGPDSIWARTHRMLDTLSGEIYMFDLQLADLIGAGEFATAGGTPCMLDELRSIEVAGSPASRMQYTLDASDTLRPWKPRSGRP